VVDDHLQEITHIVRGEDLLSNTARQIHLQQSLGYQTPSYMHLPLVTNAAGEKLSKQTKATAVNITHSESIRESLCRAANHLGLQNDPIGGSITQWLNRKVQEWQERHFI
jgi:glutamyl-Q tRNA(Asp) synthetase